MVIIHDIKKTYGSNIACDIPSMTIKEGEIVGLVGNNGAGKTTFFRLLLDLAKPDKGQIILTRPQEPSTTEKAQSIDVYQSEEWKQFTGAYLNESFLIDFLTPEEYFSFLGKISDIGQKEVIKRLRDFDGFTNGEIFGKNKLIRNLSAGNKQKIGIMSALIAKPHVIILDEPFNFLDPKSQNTLKRIIQQYNKSTGATILISSHNLSNTIDISTRIILLEKGKIICDIPNNGDEATRVIEDYFNAE